MLISLSEATSARLREYAESEGREVSEIADDLIAAALDWGGLCTPEQEAELAAMFAEMDRLNEAAKQCQAESDPQREEMSAHQADTQQQWQIEMERQQQFRAERWRAEDDARNAELERLREEGRALRTQIGAARMVELRALFPGWFADLPPDVPVTQAQRDELDRCLEDRQTNPQEGVTWQEVKAEMSNH